MKKTVLCALLVILSFGFAAGQAQYRVLWSFGGSSDGAVPLSNLIVDRAGSLYGTTKGGGNFAGGTVFRLSQNQDGTWTDTVLYSFCADLNGVQCLDGQYPSAGLVADAAGNLYGTTYNGGAPPCQPVIGCGTVFELSPPRKSNGAWTETVLYNFCTNSVGFNCLDGSLPTSQLIMDASGNLYGTTNTGGIGGTNDVCCTGGTVFGLTRTQGGWTETVLYNFCPTGGPICADGTGPQAGVTFDKAGNLYGTTQAGGALGSRGGGTLYELSPGTNGWTETVLLSDRGPFHMVPALWGR